MSASDKIIKSFSMGFVSFFGIGFIPWAPGTFGSLAAFIGLLIPEYDRRLYFIVLTVLITAIAIPVINWIEKKHGSDPPFVVIDEVCGILLILSNPYVPHEFPWLILAFCLFRLFDIWKPFPINRINSKEGGLFVMADDLLAGIYSMICLQIIYIGYRIFPFAYLYIKGS